MFTRLMLILIAIAIVAAPVGCKAKRETGRVFGRVTFQGTPLEEGTMLFSNASQGVHLMAKIETDGTYEVATFDAKGLPLHGHRIKRLLE